MTASLAQVKTWRPDALSTAATELDKARVVIDHQTKALKTTMSTLAESWTGAASDAAQARAAKEVTTGYQLADAIDAARKALDAGAADIGHAKSLLMTSLTTAATDGFTVSDDGTVTPPTLPPVMSSPEDAAAAASGRNAQQAKLNSQAQSRADDISRALTAVREADARTASALQGVDVPAGLVADVKAYLQRLEKTHDWMGSLGALGAGGVSLALALKKGVGLFTHGKSFSQFIKFATEPITDYETFTRNLAASDKALLTFMRGAENGGFMRFLTGAKAAKLLGKAFLPLTVVTGLMDTVTGGGYDGARGWATRGFGLAGAAGAGALLASSAGLIALGPVGLGIAGGAVLAYGAWSAGNFIWDHREQIGHAVSAAYDWTSHAASTAWNATTSTVSHAASTVKDGLEDAGKGALHVASFGLL